MIVGAMLVVALVGSLTTVRFPLRRPALFVPREAYAPLPSLSETGSLLEWVECGSENTARSVECGRFYPSEQGRNAEAAYLWSDSAASAITRRFLEDPARSPLVPSAGE
jgi:hypothetical protein